MTEEAKTYVFGNSDSNMGALMAAMNNGGFGGNGAWWIIILLAALWGGNGFGGRGNGVESILSTLNGDQGRDMIMSALQGNNSAIQTLANTVGVESSAIQGALSTILNSICQLGNTVGLSGQLVINSIQAGNAGLSAQLAQCCCDNRLLTTTQGYENRIALADQTSFLGAKIDYQTNFLADKFCDLEKRELQNKVDTLREEKSTLMGQISNANQTAAIQSYVASVVTPLAADVAAIKAAQPPTVSVPYPQLAAVPASYACSLAANGFGPYGFNNGFWA